VLVDGEGRCVISDFGQSEMKWEASRRSRKLIASVLILFPFYPFLIED
jgi:hypothetical protein